MATNTNRSRRDPTNGDTITRYLSAQDLADALGVPLGTVYQWNSRGTGPVVTRVGRHVRYAEPDVCRWLGERREESPS